MTRTSRHQIDSSWKNLVRRLAILDSTQCRSRSRERLVGQPGARERIVAADHGAHACDGVRAQLRLDAGEPDRRRVVGRE